MGTPKDTVLQAQWRIAGRSRVDLGLNQEPAKQPSQSSFAANGVLQLTTWHWPQNGKKIRGFIDSITLGNFHNQIAAGVETAFSAMLGRMAGRRGGEVTWEELLRHGEKFELGINMSQFS